MSTTVDNVLVSSVLLVEDGHAQCCAIECACYDKSERSNIEYEVSKPGAHVHCAYSFSSNGQASSCIGYVLFQKMSLVVSINKIVVMPSSRRMGIGKLLLSSVHNFASSLHVEMCCLNVEVTNHPAVALYYSQGYVEADHRLDFYGMGRHALRMEKKIEHVNSGMMMVKS